MKFGVLSAAATLLVLGGCNEVIKTRTGTRSSSLVPPLATVHETKVETQLYLVEGATPPDDYGPKIRVETPAGTFLSVTLKRPDSGGTQYAIVSSYATQAGVCTVRQKNRTEAAGAPGEPPNSRRGPIWDLLWGWVWIYDWYPIVQTTEAIAISDGSGIMFERDVAGGVNRIGAVQSSVTVKRLNPDGSVHSTVVIPAGELWGIPHDPTEVPEPPTLIVQPVQPPQEVGRSATRLIYEAGVAIEATGRTRPW